MDEPLLAEVVKALDIVVLKRLPDASFALIGAAPDWFKKFHDPEDLASGKGLRLWEKLAFLESFLVDAEEFWQGHASGALASGLWHEDDPSGRELHLEATALSLGDQKILIIAHVRRDYAERQVIIQRARENALIHETLLKEVQKKEILLHAIVHDLMGPLTSMSATFDILSGGGLAPEEIGEMVSIGKKVSDEQKNMISEILSAFSSDLETTDYSTLAPEDAPDAYHVAQEVVEFFRPTFIRENVKLRLVHEEVAEGAWKVIAGKSHLGRVLSNLLENALRYSPQGSLVTVGLQEDGNHVLLYVDDEGPGVPGKLSGTLFHNFVKGRQRTGKSGLGLYFCRITVERWGGTIGVSPRPEKGSRFWIRLRKPVRRRAERRTGRSR